MRVPQVSERIKEAPAQALRGVFAGIGQVLLIADRLRNKTPASQHVPPGPRRRTVATAPGPGHLGRADAEGPACSGGPASSGGRDGPACPGGPASSGGPAC